MCDCAGDASCVLRFCRAISLDAPKVADVRAAADCVEDLRGAAPDEVEAICAQWKVLAKGKFRRAVAALQEEVRQGADGAFDLDDAAPVTPAAREGEVRAAVARDGGGPEEAPAPEAPAPAPAEWLASRSGVRVGATVEKRFPGYGLHRGTIVELGADDVVVKWETDERTTLSLKEASRRVIAAPSRKTAPAAAAPPAAPTNGQGQAQPAWAAVCTEVLAAVRDSNLMGVRDRLIGRGFRCGPVYNGSKQKYGQGYYEITVPPAFPSSYYLVGKNVRMNKEVLRSKTQLVKYFEACLALARGGGAYRTQSQREAERRAAMESSDNDDEEEEDNAAPAPAPAAQVEAAPPAEAEAAPALADESEEADAPAAADDGDDDDEEEDPELAAIEDGRAAEAALIAEGERRLAAATEDEIRAAAPYAEGDQVEARFRGGVNWYPAVVVALVVDARGSFFVDLKYADGSDHAEEAVPVELVRPLQKRRRQATEEAVVEAPARPAPVPANAVRVLHKFSGYGDFEGSVVSMEADGACSVKWDADGSVTTLDQPRAPPPEATPVPDAPTPPERKPAKRARPAPVEEEAPTAARPYPVGTQVEARFKGGAKFYAAIVVAARDGAVDVTYCDGSSDAEANVPLDLVRPLQRRKRTAVAAPPAPPPPTKKSAKKKPKAKPTPKATSAIWDNGSSWRPRAEAGTRNPAYHGCGKCRWRPSGCRGCIAADAERGPQPPPRPLVRGAVTVAADKFLAPLLGAVGVPDAERRACWAGQRQTLESLVSVTSAGVVDENGFGVVAKQPLRADQIIIDPTVLLVPRPSDYARAHLPPYDYIAFGANDYALLREVALKHCSLTFYLNGADYAGSRHAPNVKWFVHRHGRGGAQLAWKLLSDVAVGEELLATYTAPEFADPPV